MEWKTVKLGEVDLQFIDGDRGKNYPKGGEMQPSGHCLFLNAGNVTADGFVFKENSFISQKKDGILRKGKLRRNDIVLTTRGTVGNVAYYSDDIPFEHVRINSGMVIVRCGDTLNPQFIYYVFRSSSFQMQIKQSQSGSAQPQLPISTLNKLLIPLPPLPAQRRIAAVLSSLDAQIENNNRINRNLEEQAQALFKSWFVDFEPWGGKMPEDWKEGSIYDVAEVLDKYRKPLSNNVREKMKKTYPYYGATSLMDYVDNYLFDGIYTLLGEDGSVIREDGTPYVQYVWGKMWVNNHAHVLQGKNGYSTELLHVMLSRLNIKALVTGAVQAKLSQGNMQKIGVVIPADNILSQFCETIGALYSQIRNNHEQSSRLAQLRDTLLPKLMKGEIDINK